MLGYSTLRFIINYNTYFILMSFSTFIFHKVVYRRLRRGGIFKHEFVANLLLSPLMKKNSEIS